jgi:hypothetical protein
VIAVAKTAAIDMIIPPNLIINSTIGYPEKIFSDGIICKNKTPKSYLSDRSKKNEAISILILR